MRIDQLRAFVRCAEVGSLSAAARAERLPKSTLSRLLRDLEASLEVPLLNRSSRGMVLTEEGALLLDRARRILDEIDSIAAAIRPSVEGPSGVVRLTTPYTFGVTFVSPLIPGFLAAYPAIDIHIELTSRNVDLVAEGYDLAIRIGPPPPDVVARRLMGNVLGLCASPDYLARRGTPGEPDDLKSHNLLLIGSPRAKASLRLWKSGSSQLIDSFPKLLSSDPAVILRSALDGVGIGQVPLIIAGRELTSGALVRVLQDWTMPEVDISLIRPAGRPILPRVRAFANYIAERIAGAPDEVKARPGSSPRSAA
jgi:DNA-binding transcriptional LysR family regulator